MWEHTNLMPAKDEGCLNNTMVGVMQVISLGSKELTVFPFFSPLLSFLHKSSLNNDSFPFKNLWMNDVFMKMREQKALAIARLSTVWHSATFPTRLPLPAYFQYFQPDPKHHSPWYLQSHRHRGLSMMCTGFVCVRYTSHGRGTWSHRPRRKYCFISPAKKFSFDPHYAGLSYKDAIARKKNLNLTENKEVCYFN